MTVINYMDNLVRGERDIYVLTNNGNEVFRGTLNEMPKKYRDSEVTAFVSTVETINFNDIITMEIA